jgi:predicted small secreted protein
MYILEETIEVSISFPNSSNVFSILKETFLKKDELCRIDREEVELSSNLEELLISLRRKPIIEGEHVLNLIFNASNVAEEKLLFETLAPFIKDGSYIKYIRETYTGNKLYIYSFNHGICNIDIQDEYSNQTSLGYGF